MSHTTWGSVGCIEPSDSDSMSHWSRVGEMRHGNTLADTRGTGQVWNESQQRIAIGHELSVLGEIGVKFVFG